MFDPENRDEGLRNRSLLSVPPEPDEPAPDPEAVSHHRRVQAAPQEPSEEDAGAETRPEAGRGGVRGMLDRLRRRMGGDDAIRRKHAASDEAAPEDGRDAPRAQDYEEETEVRTWRRYQPESEPDSTPPRDATANDDAHWQPLIDPARVVMGVVRSRWIIAATTIAGAILGVMVALSTAKEYYAATELLFDPRDIQIVDRELTSGGLPSDATLALVENQVRVITSGDVLRDVVERLDLANDPEFNGQAEGSWFDYVTDPRALLSLLRGGGEGDDSAARWTMAIGNLADSLEVERNARTFIIVIGVTTEDPEKSARIASTVADVFLETIGKLQSNTAGRANDEIISQLDELRASVEAAERAVADYKAQYDIVDAQGRLISDDEIVRLNEQLTNARARTSELNARAASTSDLDVDRVLGGSLPEQLASPVMSELLAQYGSLRQQAQRLAVRLGPLHPEQQSIQAELQGAREEIGRELRRVVSSIQVELQRAVQLEQDLAARLARLKVENADREGEQVTLRELEREASARRAVYESLLLRARETGEQRGFNTSNVSVISDAYPPLLPVGPSRSMIALAGLILGFMAGVGIGAARGAVDSFRERSPDEQGRSRPAAPSPRPLTYRDERADDAPRHDRDRDREWSGDGFEDERLASEDDAWRELSRRERRLLLRRTETSRDARRGEPGREWADDTGSGFEEGVRHGRSPEDRDAVTLDEIRQRLRAFRDEVDNLAERRGYRRSG